VLELIPEVLLLLLLELEIRMDELEEL